MFTFKTYSQSISTYYYSQFIDEKTDEQREEEEFAQGHRISFKYWRWNENPGSPNGSKYSQYFLFTVTYVSVQNTM